MATVTDKSFHSFFSEFSKYLDDNFGHPTEVEKTNIRRAPKRIRRLDSLARLIIKDQTKTNCAAVGLINNTWYFTANNYSKIKQNLECILDALSRAKRDHQGDIVGTKKARRYLIRHYVNTVPGRNNRIRLTKDVRKFLSALKTHAIFTREEISGLFKPKYYENSEKFHAEIRILLACKEIKSPIALGISKLCCKLCAAGVYAFRKTFHLNLKLRGKHGNFYFAWKPSQILLEEGFEHFVGEKAADIYDKAKKKSKDKILETLSDLDKHRKELKPFFKSEMGNVRLDSESAASLSTVGSTSSEDSHAADSNASEEPGDSSSEEE